MDHLVWPSNRTYLAIPIIIRQQLFSSFLIKRTLGIGIDQQTLYRLPVSSRLPCTRNTCNRKGTYDQNMPHTVLLIPALLECINANLAGFRYVRMENTGHHCTYCFSLVVAPRQSGRGHTFRRKVWVFWTEFETDSKVSSFVWCSSCSSQLTTSRTL